MNQRNEVSDTPVQATDRQVKLKQHVVEIISDSGEGAQKAGQSFGAVCAKMGNGVWTVEIIPADIQPPPRTKESASGIRIRVGSKKMTNAGDEADLVVAFNEIAPYSRIDQHAFKKGTLILIESMWADHDAPEVRENYARALADFKERGYRVFEIPMEEECLRVAPGAKRGKNMWVLGMLCHIYNRDLSIAEAQVAHSFRKKSEAVVDLNLKLLRAGYGWAAGNLELRFDIPAMEQKQDMVVMNGNEALGFGVLAAGIEVCSMYPITPATSASHQLAESIEQAGGLIHQAEDEIAAIGFAIGSSYAGKTAVTITSGPGLALKTEFIGLGVMAEVPLVIIDVQRGGPSTGLPTKVEQGDLLAALYGQPGDTPKIVMAPSTIEECFHFVILARQIAEAFRVPVMILTDANLATGVQPFPRPQLRPEWLAPPIDQSAWQKGVNPYAWSEETGMSKRPIPGQKDGMYTLTGLAHTEAGKVSYSPEQNQHGVSMRSRKMAAFGNSLKPPRVHGDESGGDLLVVGWGSTRGAIEEAVDSARESGYKVSALHLHFLSPMEPGLKEIFDRFKKVITVEINYSDAPTDPMITPENRRYSQLAWLLRAQTLTDVDCFSNVHGQPLRPGNILEMITSRLNH
ncbi:MAG: 2-oxoacid:acceptor oxidoreductase subunit alpha [Lewinellaceae bacterium]|nr:2-oxoacid:acceptor oxidoreductase subunit alpha [Saprospiraceae bacterium]MCB9330270.1 2-oxoacid:acceptor oxidoreductase subunit alpha [Lewinellaceae bacterium]